MAAATTILFTATNSAGVKELYVTNGTPAGMSEILAPQAAEATNAGIAPIDLYNFDGQVLVFGITSNDQAYSGLDRQNLNLWIHDGASAGTTPLLVALTGGAADHQAEWRSCSVTLGAGD